MEINKSRSGKTVKVAAQAPRPRPAVPAKPLVPRQQTREDGEKFMVAAQVSKDQLIQTFKNEDGERTNIFKLSPDGQSLTMSATIKSPQLPKPLVYSISFGR